MKNDLISRQAAIDFIDAGHLCNPNEPRWSDNEVINFIKSRPPAQGESCEYWDAESNYCTLSRPSAQPEIRPIDYQDCSNAMLKMWMDKVVTDGEYNRIMDKLNAHWRKNDE